MGEILQTWLRTRLGAIMDLSPEIFGHYTRDGNLLAQILHSYDIISRGQLGTIIRTQDPALCRVNLKHLRVWLRFLGIECEDECIEEISCGKGSTALRLFYRVYLCLENKDRLHFITLQKERERYVPGSTKFDVRTVSEEPGPYVPAEHPLARGLCETTDGIHWQRDKLLGILRGCRRERERFEASRAYPVVETVERHAAELPEGKKRDEMTELDEFARKHRVRAPRSSVESTDEFRRKARTTVEDPTMARSYVDRLKERTKRAAAFEALKSRMQKTLLSELCERVTESEDRSFDQFVAGEATRQSRYERQMIAKLGEARNQRNVIAENRRIVEELLSKAREDERRASEERERETVTRDAEDVDSECRRLRELRRKIEEERTRRLREKHGRVCREVVEDLVKISVETAECRRKNRGRVPSTILSEWKASFRECRPIFDATDLALDDGGSNVENEQGEEAEMDRESVRSVFQSKLENLESFRESIFRSYQNAEAPWDAFARKIPEDELVTVKSGESILGHVVHRLLEYLYPHPVGPTGATLPALKIIAAILGVSNSRETIEELLLGKRIRVVRLEDAINYCLSRYKSEMRDAEYVDLKIVEATATIVKELETGKKKRDEGKKGASTGRSRKSVETRFLERGREGLAEKQTQTPRNIPYDDMHPILTDAAYVGKWSYEFLALGQPISAELEAKVLIEYLKSLTDVEGWVLLDYPRTYEQMSRFESELTGRKVPADPEVLDFQSVGIEDVDPLAPRIVFEDEAVDGFAFSWQSRLLPNPISCKDDRPSDSTFLTDYVRVVAKAKGQEFTENETYEVLADTATSLDRFYAERGVAHVFYYTSLDRSALEILTTFLLNRSTNSSAEQFAETDAEGLGGAQASEAPIILRLVTNSPRPSEKEYDDLGESLESSNAEPVRPSEEAWQVASLSLPPVLVESLARHWESLEDVYIEDTKDVLLLRYVHASSVVPYADLLTRSAGSFVGRPDEKELPLKDFQRFYESVNEDARDDADVKCELHRRVADLQSELWEVCDRRRREAEETRIRLAGDSWTATEAIVLYNVYAGFLQAEIDRCAGTVDLLADYYNAMLRMPLQEARLLKDYVVDKLEMDTEQPIDISDYLVPSEKSSGRKDRMERSKSKPVSSKSPVNLDRARLEEETFNLLANSNDEDYEISRSLLYVAIMENFRSVRKFLDSIESRNNLIWRKETSKGGAKTRGSKGRSVDTVDGKVRSEEGDVLKQWRYAVDYESWRIRSRLEMLEAAAEADVTLLLDTVRLAFRQIRDSIVDRYKREIKCVNDMANVFCLAIEEGKSLEVEMSLKGDRLVVRPKTSITSKREIRATFHEEIPSASQFRIGQLMRFLRIFQRVAPHGSLTEGSFVYILQDLVAYGNHEDDSKILPCLWYELRPKDVTKLVGRLFGKSERVDWREFLIYSLDLPMPSYQEILQVRRHFRSHDPRLKETVTREAYDRIPLWFLSEEENSESQQTRKFRQAFREFEEEDFGDEVYPDSVRTFDSTIVVSPSRNAEDLNEKTDSASREAIRDLEGNIESRETSRRTHAKELLWHMYSLDRTQMNYTALLLGFCKDEDPLEGFAKALTLAIGARVCSDVELGEKYVAELLEEKRQLRLEALETVEGIVNHAVDEVFGIVSKTDVSSSFEDGLTQHPSVLIENVDETDRLDDSPNVDTYEDTSTIDEKEDRRTSTFSSGLTMDEGPEGVRDEETIVYWLPFQVCLSVLAATLAGRNFREGVTRVYEDLMDSGLNERTDSVLAHRLLHHDFIKTLLNGRFTVRNAGEIAQEILRERKTSKISG